MSSEKRAIINQNKASKLVPLDLPEGMETKKPRSRFTVYHDKKFNDNFYADNYWEWNDVGGES